MAQAITNTVQSSNSLAGLLGLNPKPLSNNVFGNMANTTPSAILPKAPAPAQPSNATIAGLLTSSLPKGAPQTTSAPVNTSPVANNASYNPNAGYMSTNYSTGAGTPAPLATPTTPAAPTPAPTQGLFPSVLSSLASSGVQNNALAANAQKIANDAGQKIADIGGQGARFEAGQLTTGTSPVAEGNAAVTAQSTSAAQQAVAQGANVALTGNQQGITAQGQTQSALTSAANLAQPSTAAYGQTVFDPVSGQYTGGGGLPAEVMQQYAQMAATGQYAAIPSFITSNPVLNAQLNVAAKGINPGYTPVGAQGASGVLGGIPALQSANAAADGIKNTIQTYLQANPQLNPSNLAAGNQLQQWIQGKQLTDPKYQTLFNYLDEFTNTLAPILGVGGDPTNLKTQIAQGFVNGAASGQSISQVLNAISALATNKITDLQSGAVGGGTSVPSATGGGAAGSGSVWDF